MSVIIKPHITEKAASLAKNDRYIFVVDKDANKVEIGKAIKRQYKVTPLSVNTQRCIGKKVVRYKRKRVEKGQRSLYKKAIITLKKGEQIDLQSHSS